jgi:hypothetical protein
VGEDEGWGISSEMVREPLLEVKSEQVYEKNEKVKQAKIWGEDAQHSEVSIQIPEEGMVCHV